MILLNAANGQQGRHILPRLVEAGLAVRAFVRSESSAATVHAAGAAEVIIGDIGDPDTVAQAMRGIATVYHVCPGIDPRERAIGMGMIEAARAAGVRHFVFSSVLHAVLTDLVQHEIKRDIEEALISSHLEYTILQPSIYMPPKRLLPAFRTGTFTSGWSLERRQSMVHIGDIAEVAAKVLGEGEPHYAATYELAAPGRYDTHEMAAIIARISGRPVEARQVDSQAYLKLIFGDRDLTGLEHEVRVCQTLTSRYSSNDFLGNGNVLGWLLGRAPTSFEQFVAAQYAAFAKETADA